MPSAAEIDVDAWPAPNGSYGDSLRIAKPEMPPPLRSVSIRSRAAGQHLVDVRLVADVPHELVLGHVEHAVQRQRQFDDAEVRREVAAVARRRAISTSRISRRSTSISARVRRLRSAGHRCVRDIWTGWGSPTPREREPVQVPGRGCCTTRSRDHPASAGRGLARPGADLLDGLQPVLDGARCCSSSWRGARSRTTPTSGCCSCNSAFFTSIGPMLYVFWLYAHRPHLRPRHVHPRRTRSGLHRVRRLLSARHDRICG